MVKGLGVFKNYFKDFGNNYIIIGGTACDMIIDAAGLTPRATRDIDIVLVVEALNCRFVERFWDFVRDGQYAHAEKNVQQRKYYRFSKPSKNEFPYQVELFSRTPDTLKAGEEVHLTPIPVDDDLSSLSAILMDEDYYAFTLAHCAQQDGLRRASPEALICLKAKAYLDLNDRKTKGANVEDKLIKKHRSDVFRLAVILAPGIEFILPATIKRDMQLFAEKVKNDLPDRAIFREMGLGNIDPQILFRQLTASFRLQLH
jgi:hypothetical protein